MATIPSSINGVTAELAPTVGNDVDQRVVEGLKCCVKAHIAAGHQRVMQALLQMTKIEIEGLKKAYEQR